MQRFFIRLLLNAAMLGVLALLLWYVLSLPPVAAVVEHPVFTGAVTLLAGGFAASVALHLLYCIVARRLGVWNPGTYHLWLWLPWRPLAQAWLSFGAWRDREWSAGRKATGGFAGILAKLCLVYRPGDVLLGRMSIMGFGLFQPLGTKLERHLFMFASTGAGKTTLLITMLGLHPGNAFVIDPKGQIAKILHRRRGRGGNGVAGLGKDVAVLDPYGIVHGVTSATWNPLEEIERAIEREGPEGAVKYAEKISEGLVRIEGRQPFFPRAARKFLTGLILHVLTTEPREKRNILRVCELVNLGYSGEMREEMRKQLNRDPTSVEGFAALLTAMRRNRRYSAISAAATMFDDARSAGDVMATLKVSLGVYDNEQLRAISKRSSFSLHDLKLGNQDVFVCAPTGALSVELSGWFRMLTVFGLGVFEYIPGDLKPKCFFAIDELPSLGTIEKLAVGPAVLRAYGVQLLGISQDIDTLKKAYPESWTTWIGNADAVYWMASNDTPTLDYLGKMIGAKTRARAIGGGGEDREVMSPEQLRRYLDPDTGNMIVTRFGKRALRVKTAPYYTELPVAFYDPDPDHQERGMRAATRQSPISIGAGGGIKQIAQEARKALAPPEPLTVSRDQALAMFGLQEGFRRADLDARRRQMHNAAGSDQMIEAIELAYLRLTEREGA